MRAKIFYFFFFFEVLEASLERGRVKVRVRVMLRLRGRRDASNGTFKVTRGFIFSVFSLLSPFSSLPALSSFFKSDSCSAFFFVPRASSACFSCCFFLADLYASNQG